MYNSVPSLKLNMLQTEQQVMTIKWMTDLFAIDSQRKTNSFVLHSRARLNTAVRIPAHITLKGRNDHLTEEWNLC